MKTAKVIILVIIIASVGILMPATALAGGHGGGGHHGHGGHYGHHGYSYWSFGFGYWGPWYYPSYSRVVFVDPYYYPPYTPVVVTPPVVVDRPVVVRPEIAVAPKSVPTPVYNGLGEIRQRKAQLLNQLRQTDKIAKLQAISELAGFSFDDQVKAALENILLSDPDAAMRIEAAISFGKVKNQGALPVLEKVRVQDSDREVREAADKAISQIKS